MRQAHPSAHNFTDSSQTVKSLAPRLAAPPTIQLDILMIQRAAIIGDGAMGTVCAMLLAGNGVSVRLWGRDAERTRNINVERQNRQYLPG